VSVSVAALTISFAPSAWRFAEACALLMQLTAAPLPAAVERVLLHEIDERELSLHTSGVEVRGRRYIPRSSDPAQIPKLLLLHGVHAQGIDEPRLIALGRALARAGLDVMTPELTALTRYQVQPESVSEIDQIARAWATEQHSRSLGVIGISFAGGLALMAAAAQGGSAPIGFVLSVGAHHDLTRVCDFYAGRDVRGPELEPPGVAPHPYGARVFLRRELPRLLGPDDLALATQALDTYLHDRPQEARQLATGLSPAGQETMRVLLDGRGSETLSRWLTDSARRDRPQLSAAAPRGHLAGLQVPVLLLHGQGDPIVPSIETRYLARELPPGVLRDMLITDLLRHAELSQLPELRQVYRFARFMQRFLRLAHATAAANARSSPDPRP
jgi:pimeloyl-ACP methyl ester carboxylesterase